MKKITVFETSDNKIHKNEIEAKKHAENRYGNELCRLARILVKIEKYTHMNEWLDTNLHQFDYLIKLRQDIIIEGHEDDELDNNES